MNIEVTAAAPASVDADLLALATSGYPITAAAFLERFAGEEPWAPVDMIGPALLDDDRGDAVGRGASGYGVRMLIELASRLSDPQAERS
jgi:leucyl aminopeptidase